MVRIVSLLLCGLAAVYGHEVLQVDELDELFAAKIQETQRAFLGVEKQLNAAREVMELFVLEDTQLQMFALETKATLTTIQDEVRSEMKDSMLEVEQMREEAVANATMWKKTLQELKEATKKNEQILHNTREEKKRELEEEIQRQKEQELKAKRELELLQELEKQRELEKELEKQAEEEMKRLQEIEKQRELEKLQIEKQRELEELREQQHELEQQQVLEKEQELQLEREKMKELKKQEEQRENKMEKETSSIDSTTSNDGGEVVALPSDVAEGTSTVKWVLAWYVSMEQTVLDVATAVYRQLVLPVVAILSLFLMLTVAIAKYNAMKQARRNRRVLYSGYPKSFRPKAKQEMNPVPAGEADLRPRLRHPMPRRDPNGFIGN